ncbi:UNVERIFIED_CONTAM: hypothetical protein FKN15_055170 [Acipenser sinensis]
MTSASSYVQSMTCRYSPWAERVILCERNYMEVSVRRGVPLIEPNLVQDDPDWSLAYPEAIAADNSIWKIVFHLPANRKTAMTVAQAMTNGYGINTTPTRILVRAAYNSTESQPQGIHTVPMAVLRSTTFYKQRWMVMMVDTAVTCPTDGTAVTEQMITWNVPRVVPPLVPTPQITTLDVEMGVHGHYKLDVGPQLITVKIPVGAVGGYYKSHVLDNTYVISYSIEPMLEHTWQDGPEKTKYTVLHPITTPFMPRPPVVTNNTVPKARVFNVTLGTFLPDVELVKIIVGPETLTVPEANLKGHNVQEHVFPNGSKTYTLQVPFEDPNVQQKSIATTALPLAVPPTVTGYCDGAAFYTMVMYGNMGRNWVPFVGSRELGGSLLALYKYNANTTNFWMTVPYNSIDATYEVISSSGIRSRLDLTLKDIGTMVVVADFSLSCSFPTKMIDCFTNGTMAALAVKVESVPSLFPSQLTLRDPSCRPLQSDAINAVFNFNVNSCDSTYNDFYGARDYPVVKYLRRPLYFEVELLYSRDPQAELFLENCWATYSADRNSSPKWDVVVDSCENSADEYLTIFHPLSSNARVLFPSHLKRFEVKMFSFTSGRDALKGQIYFHCSVVICDSNRPSDSLCSRRCIPGKQRLDNKGALVSLSPRLAAQCGYSLTVDFLGNAKFLASVLSCFAQNTNDETYKLTVQISVFSNSAMTSASSYVQSMTCPYSPWTEREILCERNYMEVSVRRGVPLIEPNFVQDDPDWSLAYPEATAADNSIWKIVFHLPANRKTAMTVAQAMTNGYGINTTPTRILVRAAYNSTESQPQGIQTVPMAVLRSTTFYKQRWMVVMVDTAVTCPTDGTAFTEQMITWNVPRVLPPLVPTPQITTLDVQMGVDGHKLDPATIHNRDYKLDVGPQLITVKIPVGADGGYYKNHVLDNTYVISYSIEPMLEHTWQDGPEKTKYTVLHPITTPFMPRPPVVTNNTVPKARVFNVTLGTFLPDVELVKIIVGPETLTVPEANLKGYNVQEHVFPNGSKTYTLQVPFEDPNVKQKVTPPDTRTYILPLTYLLNIVPENTPFTHPAVVEAILKDIIPPTVTGYCDGAAFYTMVISSSGIRSRLDLTLKDVGTMVVVADFSLSCSFPTKMIDCFTNGTMAALAVKVESVPSLSPSQLTLRDPSCRPLQSDAINAVFYFNVNSCGTTRRFDNNLLTYENEVLFTYYRLRVACHYLVNDTKVVQFLYQNNPAPVVQPGLGDLAIIMQLALDSTYNDFYGAQDYPVVKYLRRPLYFEVELLYSRDPQAELFLENCWATYSADRNSSPKWDVVVDSCENSADEYLTIFHPVSSNARVLFPSHLKRFEVKMFSFTSGRDALKGQIYFHCSVVICDSNRPSDSLCSRRCIPGKQRLGRSAEGMDGGAVKAFVSSGPIELKKAKGSISMPRSDIRVGYLGSQRNSSVSPTTTDN